MAANEGHFTIAEVLDQLNRKLIRRHPHVFGDEASRAAGNLPIVDADVEGSSAAVLRNWEEIKKSEKQAAERHCMQRTRLRRKSNRSRGSTAFFAPCLRLLKPPSSAPRRRNPASTGRAGASCFPKSPRRQRSLIAEAESVETDSNRRPPAGYRGRTGRPAVYRRQSWPASRRGCRDGIARLQSALPSALQRDGTRRSATARRTFAARAGGALGAGEEKTGSNRDGQHRPYR